MKYCIDFFGKQIDLLNEIDEINIDIFHIKELENTLEEFCELHKNQKINLCINDYERAINEKLLDFVFDFQNNFLQYNIGIRLPGYSDWYVQLKEKYPNSKVFFEDHITDWDQLLFYISQNITDIYITENMGFELEKIAEIAHQNNVKIRVFPNVAQSSRKETKDLWKFWIRPEDFDIYEKYIDVYEFYYERYEQQEIYYNIYAKDKKWLGNLNEIIIGLQEDFDSTRIVPRFAQKRVRCGRECMKGGKCKICDRVIELSQTLEKTPIRVVVKKEEGLNGSRTDSESGNSTEDIK